MPKWKHVNRVMRVEGDVAVMDFGGYEVLIDADDLPLVTAHHWTPYQGRRSRSGSIYFQGKPGLLHRLIMGFPEDLQIDHFNHNTLDNRRTNLRIVTNQVNNANRAGPYSSNKTGVRGLSIHRKTDGGQLYVVRCHIATCKVTRYFQMSELEEAKSFALAHFAGLPDKPASRRTRGSSESGVPGIVVMRAKHSPGYVRYRVQCQRRVCPVKQFFPYTPDGLLAAKLFLEDHDKT